MNVLKTILAEKRKRNKAPASKSSKPFKNLLLSEILNNKQITINDLYDLKPKEFEKLCEKILRNLGFDHIIPTRASHDYGIDIFADYEDKKYAIQCKKFRYICDKNKTSWVESSIVRELVGSVESQYWKFKNKMIMATSCFGPDAIEIAKQSGVELVGVPRKYDEDVANIMDVVKRSGIFGNAKIIDPELF